MTLDDRDRRHRWAETCERLADWLDGFVISSWAMDLREIAAYLRAPETERPSSAKEEG